MKTVKARGRGPAASNTEDLKTMPLVTQTSAEEEGRFVGQDLLDALEEQIKLEADPAPGNDNEARGEWNQRRSGKARSKRKRAAKQLDGVNCSEPGRGDDGNTLNKQLPPPSSLGSQALFGRGDEYPMPPYRIPVPSVLPNHQNACTQPQTLPHRASQSRSFNSANARPMQQNLRNESAQSLSNNQQMLDKPIDETASAQGESRNAVAATPATGKFATRMGQHVVDEQGRIVYRSPPEPSEAYIQQSNQTPGLERRTSPRRLLIILDLNGVLIFRPTRKQLTKFKPRPGLDAFFDYIFTNHEVMVWSSVRPENANPMCEELFSKEQYSKLVAIWARDKLRLAPIEYNSRSQVYKQLSWVWGDDKIGARALSVGQEKWSQSDTVLIDDSSIKASAEPYNLLQVPEFKGQDESYSDGPVLDQVVGYLEQVRYALDASRFIRVSPFTVNAGWTMGASSEYD